MADYFISGLQFLFPGECYEKVFRNYDFFNETCFKLFLSRWLGLSIVAGSAVVKLPQVIKILRAGSVEGLSLLSVLLEVTFCLFTFAYNFARGFPFSTYGESVFLTIQVAVIVTLIFYYQGNMVGLMCFLLGLSGAVYYLLSGLAPLSLLSTLQSASIPILVISRSTQIITTFKAKTTGQLSFVTAFMLFGGSLARVFTTLQETGDFLMLVNYMVGLSLNTTIIIQFFLYWNADKPKKE